MQQVSDWQKQAFEAKDFPLDTDASNLSRITLSARYPQTGVAMNLESEMTCYVVAGAAVLQRESREIIQEGSAVLIKRNERYFWEPQENVTLLIFSTPPWTAGQQRLAKS